MKTKIKIRKAKIKDVKHILRLINFNAGKGKMLYRKKDEVLQNLRDYFVAKRPKVPGIAGCVSLHIYTDRLSEIKGLVVKKRYCHHGLGSRLVKRCLQEAKDLGISKVFALTYVPGFFEQLGFIPSNKELLPEKIWKECEKCSKFNSCDEKCMAYNVKL